HLEPVRRGLLPARAAGPQANHHVVSAVLQVERMGTALAAVTEDGDALAAQDGHIDIGLLVHLHVVKLPFVVVACGRSPVRRPGKKNPAVLTGSRGSVFGGPAFPSSATRSPSRKGAPA